MLADSLILVYPIKRWADPPLFSFLILLKHNWYLIRNVCNFIHNQGISTNHYSYMFLINDSEIRTRILGFKTFCLDHSEFIKKNIFFFRIFCSSDIAIKWLNISVIPKIVWWWEKICFLVAACQISHLAAFFNSSAPGPRIASNARKNRKTDNWNLLVTCQSLEMIRCR